MQTTVKDTYSSFQSRVMYFAFGMVTVMSIILMILESYNIIQGNPNITQMVFIMSFFMGILYSMVAMLIVEVVYQEDFNQFPFISRLARLTPELTIVQRYTFLTLIFKRQIISVMFLVITWINVGGTHRAEAFVFAMTIITVFTLFGTYHIKALPPPPEDTGNLIDKRMSG